MIMKIIKLIKNPIIKVKMMSKIKIKEFKSNNNNQMNKRQI